MSFNGTGIFLINTSGQPVVTGTTITSTAFNALTTDLGTGLTNCLTKDGQSTPTANIKMGSYKLTGLGVATTAGDALSFGNIATITTLTLTNALSVANGGSGAITADAALTNFGGTTVGKAVFTAANAAAARTAITAAASGANSDITSLTGLTVPLVSVAFVFAIAAAL